MVAGATGLVGRPAQSRVGMECSHVIDYVTTQWQPMEGMSASDHLRKIGRATLQSVLVRDNDCGSVPTFLLNEMTFKTLSVNLRVNI